MKNVTAAIILKHNSILITRRKKGQTLEGYWEFPGGKIEKDETPQECLERELYEELNIRAIAKEVIDETVYTYTNGTIKLIAIKTKIENENFCLSVHDKVKWVPISDLLLYNLAPADIAIAKTIMKRYNDV